MFEKDKTQSCNWCGNPCSETTQAIRHTKLTFITSGVVEEGDAAQEVLYFCSRQHRVMYLYYP